MFLLRFLCVLLTVGSVNAVDSKTLSIFARQMERENTVLINFSERKPYFERIISDLRVKSFPGIPFMDPYLTRAEKFSRLLSKLIDNAESHQDLQEFYIYFDILIYNLVRINYFSNENRSLDNLKIEFPPRLLQEIKTLFQRKTWKRNVLLRRSFIYDFWNSRLMNEFSASEKLRIKTYLNTSYQNKPKEAYTDTGSILTLILSRIQIEQGELIKPVYHFLPQDFIMPTQNEISHSEGTEAMSPKSVDLNPAVATQDAKKHSIPLYLLIGSVLFLSTVFLVFMAKRGQPSKITPQKERTKTSITSLTPDLPKSVNLDPILEMMVQGIPERYQGISKLSKGGMGTVFLATDALLNRKVAIKMIHPQFNDDETIRMRFINEARAIAALEHPNILKIYDVGIDPYPFFVMELLQGADLDQILIKRGKFQGSELITYGAQLSDAILYCHKKGILHRDIKPANVIVVQHGHAPSVRLVDFGIAKNTHMADMTNSNVTMGSPLYMAPEQLQKGIHNQKTDIYAFGMTLYRMATGTLPFSGEHMSLKMTEDPMPIWNHLPEFHKLLGALIMKCIHRDPEQRLPSMEQVLALFNKLKTAN